MQIERNALKNTRVASVTMLRETCIGCKDCNGPCHTLMQMSALPDLLLDTLGAKR